MRNTQEVSCFGLHVIFVEEIAQRTWLLPSDSLQLCIDGSSSGTSLAILQEVSSFGGWLACDSICTSALAHCSLRFLYYNQLSSAWLLQLESLFWSDEGIKMWVVSAACSRFFHIPTSFAELFHRSVVHWWERSSTWLLPIVVCASLTTISQEDSCFGGWLACDSARIYCGRGCPSWTQLSSAWLLQLESLFWSDEGIKMWVVSAACSRSFHIPTLFADLFLSKNMMRHVSDSFPTAG